MIMTLASPGSRRSAATRSRGRADRGPDGDVRVGAPQHGGANRGDVKRIMVSDVAFDALTGGASHVVRELVERNPKFEGSAGLTAHRFVEREVRVSARGAP